ncbi:MAG: sugar-binding transcriptional regulator [Chloroflexi bacterium]|nr:sugar-binding transcriptional regulator [Chloroflexota bacterium]
MVKKQLEEKLEKLADVAEMYFVEGLTQSEIAKKVDVTRSMVSRMLTEARQRGIVKIHIERPYSYNSDLQAELSKRFRLKKAVVFCHAGENATEYLSRLGEVSAQELNSLLKNQMVLGVAWGTALSATIDALESRLLDDIKIVQLVGALGGRNLTIDGHSVVRRLVEKLGGEGYYLNVPYIVDSLETVETLMQASGVKETMDLVSRCDVGLFGVGSVELDYSTFYADGYLILDEMQGLERYGALGNVCGLFFDENGEGTAREFQDRSFTIRKRELMKIPTRIGVAGGVGKPKAILGALRGQYVNYLITDDHTATEILQLDNI